LSRCSRRRERLTTTHDPVRRRTLRCAKANRRTRDRFRSSGKDNKASRGCRPFRMQRDHHSVKFGTRHPGGRDVPSPCDRDETCRTYHKIVSARRTPRA
jgi:hypothetical protein